ncbi:hypothetical protein EUGRSUZ_F00021 [Eucalyptus grandis]|uniref:Uncharacterized protein n=2 Tax=Eucalyptus grandis TaxID=71139 RepID=A0ACC3KA35_EUCGR|nr:hypothetical protein EUGRSUZ_F00021 [Eucalyptus grandis]
MFPLLADNSLPSYPFPFLLALHPRDQTPLFPPPLLLASSSLCHLYRVFPFIFCSVEDSSCHLSSPPSSLSQLLLTLDF